MESSASSIPSILQSLHSWFTPTIFFLLLNLMIAAIVVTSNLPNKNQQKHHKQEEEEGKNKNSQPENDGPPAKLAKSPSILRRLKLPETQEALHVAATEYVFNQPLHLHPTFSDDTPAAVADVLETETTHFGFDSTREEERQELEGLDEVYSRLKGGQVNREKSDTMPALMKVLPAKMQKSASLKEDFSSFEEDKTVEGRRPLTVRGRAPAAMVEDDDDVEVDSKADDFINKFKNDLKLQRIDSIIRWKGASRGTAK